MINNLKGKLDALRSQRQLERANEPEPPKEPPKCRLEVHHYPLQEAVGCYRLADGLVPAQIISALTLTELPKDISPEQILYLDTETTGLSSGPGTVAFLVGVGYFRDQAYHVEQYLLQDYDQEPDMLHRLQARLDEFSVLATYNGKSYDAPLLESRFVLNRLYPGFRRYIHLDLLHAVRRLYKQSLHPCSLGMAEEAFLGIHREDDIPGEQIPQCFFAYLQDHDETKMNRIVEHNRQDIVTLPILMAHMARDMAEAQDQDILTNLGKLMVRQGRSREAAVYFERAGTPEALWHWAMMEKEAHRRAAAEPLWQKLLEHPQYSLDAAQELAKYYEHELKDIERAWALVKREELFLRPLGKKSPELRTRRERLERKLSAKEYKQCH